MVSCATEGNIEELMAFNPCSMLSEPKKYWRIRPQLDSNLQIGTSGAVLVGFLISCEQVRNSCGDASCPKRGICVLTRVSSHSDRRV